MVKSILPQSRLQWTSESSADWLLVLPSLSGAFARLSLHPNYLQCVSIPTAFSRLQSFTASRCSRKPGKKLGLVDEQSYGRRCTLASQVLDIFRCVQASPRTTGLQTVQDPPVEQLNWCKYMSIYARSTSPLIFVSSRCINAAGGRGNYERQASTGRGGVCLCHSPALGAAEAQSLLHLQAGRSLTEQKALELETAEKPETCLSAGIMAPVQKFQTPDNLKSSFLQLVVFFFEWYK